MRISPKDQYKVYFPSHHVAGWFEESNTMYIALFLQDFFHPGAAKLPHIIF